MTMNKLNDCQLKNLKSANVLALLHQISFHVTLRIFSLYPQESTKNKRAPIRTYLSKGNETIVYNNL